MKIISLKKQRFGDLEDKLDAIRKGWNRDIKEMYAEILERKRNNVDTPKDINKDTITIIK